jgi:folate-binding Fe-S cluster repair protein YgfZ
MTLPDHHLDDAVPAHHGDPFAEQRAMARQAAVVDRGHRGVIAVAGPDRLDWLHLLITQHVSALPDRGATEALVLDGQGRVLHHMGVAQVGDVVYLDVEAAELVELLGYLQKMVFWSKVEPRDATAELAVLSLVGPQAQAVLAALDVPVPEGAAPLEGGGYVRRTRGPALVDLVVPRAAKARWWERITAAGARPAGSVAYEALRVAAVLPRAGLDTDDRTIPHEVGWIGTVVQHHELGPVALALVKRSVPLDAELTAGADTPARIDPTSAAAEETPAPGRAAQERLRGR